MFVRLYPSDKLIELPFEARRIEAVASKLQGTKTKAAEKSDTMALSSKSLAGPGYIILNGIRVMNIVGFLAVITASVVMLIKIDTDTHLFFFDALSHVITLITSIFLVTSEISLFRAYFARNWPLLSPSHGFVTLALAMIVLGINIMGNLNKPSGTAKELGLAFWRIVIASGILIFILGHINLLASYIFRDRKNGITARQVRAHGAVAVHNKTASSSSCHASDVGSYTPPAPVLAQSYIPMPIAPSPTNGTRNPFRFNSNSASNRPQSQDLPSYHSASAATNHKYQPSVTTTTTAQEEDRPVSPTSRYSRLTNCTKKKVGGLFFGRGGNRESLAPPLPVNPQQPQREMEISAPMGVNPQFAHLVQRPDSALHPSRSQGESQAFRWRV